MEDEIGRVIEKDYSTMAISYGLMFLYIAVALGQYKSPARLLVDAKLTVGIVGVLIVVMSVTASVGLAGYIGLPATMIVAEVGAFFFSLFAGIIWTFGSCFCVFQFRGESNIDHGYR